jgi:NAD+ synthase
VGDVAGNADKARGARVKAAAAGAELVLLSELFTVDTPALQAACPAAMETLAHDTADGGHAMLIGTPWLDDSKLCNIGALLESGRIASLRFKVYLPD